MRQQDFAKARFEYYRNMTPLPPITLNYFVPAKSDDLLP